MPWGKLSATLAAPVCLSAYTSGTQCKCVYVGIDAIDDPALPKSGRGHRLDPLLVVYELLQKISRNSWLHSNTRRDPPVTRVLVFFGSCSNHHRDGYQASLDNAARFPLSSSSTVGCYWLSCEDYTLDRLLLCCMPLSDCEPISVLKAAVAADSVGYTVEQPLRMNRAGHAGIG